jgi:YD repeat-containing protein
MNSQNKKHSKQFGQGQDRNDQGSSSQRNSVGNAQQISLPKGGAAVMGIGEKFSPDPFTGTFSISVPVFTTPSRWDFYPKLSLSYDSAGNGNGPFGLGWNVSIPSITRKTEKGIPRYDDAKESDVFILSGAEDLVPLLETSGGGKTWTKSIRTNLVFEVEQYRPRVEGLFAKIEKWRNKTTGEIYWRTISKDNITTFYGRTPASRISDPDDPTRIFEWMIDESHDDKGNVITYEYKQENADNVNSTLAHERNRLGKLYSKNYIKRIKYANKPSPRGLDFQLEVVFDYGEHDLNNQPYIETKTWPLRPDALSTYRSGFEVRTQRLCRRIMMFHITVRNGMSNLVEQIQYGESMSNAKQFNLLGQPVTHKGQAGLREFLSYDIEQHNTQLRTTLRTEYKKEVDWSGAEALDTEQYMSEIAYDALDRIVVRTQSDGTVQQYTYHQSGPLKSVAVKLTQSNSLVNYVQDIEYNAKGQRESILYGNGTVTTYEYESETFRLQHLQTVRVHSRWMIKQTSSVTRIIIHMEGPRL